MGINLIINYPLARTLQNYVP